MAEETPDPGMTGSAPEPVEQGPGEAPRKPKRTVLRVLACLAVLTVALVSATGWWLYRHLDGNIRVDSATEKALSAQAGKRPQPPPGAAQNILIMGSDYRPELGSGRSDTVLLVHLSGDGKGVHVVSVPRDLMVNIPACQTADGGLSQAQYAQFNWSFAFGGAACTIRTFEDLTDIRVDHHIVVGFDGFAKIIDAIGGVEMDLPQAERDPNVGLDLTAGPHLLDGTQALAYVRAREYIGDGSDTNRMARQQQFLRLVSAKVRSAGVLFDPVRLYRVLDSATSAITADPGLASLDKLYGLVQELRSVPQGNVDYRTVPLKPYPPDPNRDLLSEPAADDLFAGLRADRPIG
jgi:LCP family protein required for cell wall assembly